MSRVWALGVRAQGWGCRVQ